MNTEPLIPHRNAQGPSDPLLDAMLREALQEQEQQHQQPESAPRLCAPPKFPNPDKGALQVAQRPGGRTLPGYRHAAIGPWSGGFPHYWRHPGNSVADNAPAFALREFASPAGWA